MSGLFNEMPAMTGVCVCSDDWIKMVFDVNISAMAPSTSAHGLGRRFARRPGEHAERAVHGR
jgi:hypothetical protein